MTLFSSAKPFLKWAGGKTQLINDIKNKIPKHFVSEDFIYIEPFVGGGSVLFWIMNNYKVRKAIINDINPNLINTYQNIQKQPKELLYYLNSIEKNFHSKETEEEKRTFYNQHRDLYNEPTENKALHAALFIFLNKTCFNGLYRVNKKGKYNVPMGNYKKPTICDEENILAVSELLQNVEIICGDFENTLAYAKENTLFYLDPPYKPLNDTSSFNSYSEYQFGDKEQIRLRDFCIKLDENKFHWVLSNSDMKNINKDDDFFDELYSKFKIERVNAKRNINSNGNKRGNITELLIHNKITV